MSIRITWRKGANVEMQVDNFDSGEAFLRSLLGADCLIKSWTRTNEWLCS